ncbi:hemin uptake protein HemP [Pandoraea eparura]|uniref:Hemin uptake protein HemP n=1 Tax=Pandoraea eparura TaxID=2508291 RepID=A0A5E4SS20_9BURK|nr:hemin uptake protein HemP [Pandoraea eparura]
MTASHTPARQTPPATALRRTLSASRAQAASPAKPASQTTGRALTSDHLLQGAQCVNILHNGQTYQLRATRYGKLILTK